MDSNTEKDDTGARKRGRPKLQDKIGVRHSTDVRRSGRIRVPRTNKLDSEERDTKQKCTRWKTVEKQILLRALKEKSAVGQFSYNSIGRLVKTKKKIDVELYLKRIRKRAMKAKIEAMRKKAPIEIWQDLMKHFGDADNYTRTDMSKVMVMASLERAINCDSITSNDFKPRRVYRYIAALFKSKELPTLTSLESQVILDCFENMLEVLKGSEIRDKAAFLRAQYFNLYNKAFTGGNNYSVEDNLGLVPKETQSEQPHSSNSSSQPETTPTASIANAETHGRCSDESVPGISHTVPETSGEANERSARRKVLWRGGLDRSNEVRLLNPLGIPVEMLEFRPRDEENNSSKRWTYEYTGDSSDSDDSYGDWDDDEGGDSRGTEKQSGHIKRKRGGKGREDQAGTCKDDGQDSGGNSAGEPNDLQDMTEILDTDQYAFVTEEEFAKKGKIYLQALAAAHSETDGNLDVQDVVNSDQYIFVPKDDFARESSLQGLKGRNRGENDASPDIREREDEPIPMDEAHVNLDTESVDHYESESFEINGRFEPDDSFAEGNLASDVDQSEVRDGSMNQSDFVANEIGRSDGLDPNQPDEFGVEINLSDDEDMSPIEDTLLSTDPIIPPTCTPSTSESIVGDDIMSLTPLVSTDSLPEQPSCCVNSMEILTAVSLSSNETTVSNPINTITSQEFPKHNLVSKPSSPEKIHETDVSSPSTPSAPSHTSQAPWSVKTGAVQLVLPQKKSESNASSLPETSDDSTSSTIPLENAMIRGIVSSELSDDQLLTIDVSQLGPDSKIVIPSYLLPGGILTIRSPEVSRLRRPDHSLVQAGPDSTVANTQSSQSQGGVSQANQSHYTMLPDMALERVDPAFSTQVETTLADTNSTLDPSSQAQLGVSYTSQDSDNILEDIAQDGEAESMSDDEISQTEYVIASDQPSKESNNLCEVHVIANRILKPSNQAEVPRKTSPKVLQTSRKVEDSNVSMKIHSEVVQAEEEEVSFLDFLTSQKSVLGWRKESTEPKGLLNENGIGNLQLKGHGTEKSAVGISLIGVSKANISHPLKHKGKSPPTTNGQPLKQLSVSNVGHEPLNASGLHDTVTPKKKVGRPPKVRAETDAVSRVVLENQDHRYSSTFGEKRKRGRPAKPKSTEQSLLVSEMEQVASADFCTEVKRNRGRPRKTEKRVSVDLEVSVLDNVKAKEPTVEDLGELEAIKSTEVRNHIPIKEKYAGTSLSLDNPPISPSLKRYSEKENGNNGSSSVSTYLQRNLPKHDSKDIGLILSYPATISLPGMQQKRKRGRPHKRSRPDSLPNLPYNVDLCQPIEKKVDFGKLGTDSAYKRKKSRKRGRPRKETQSDALEDLEESPVMHHSPENGTSKEQLEDNLWTERKDKRRRGRPRKDSKSDSCDEISDRERPRKETQSDALEDLQESPVIHQSTENGTSKEQLEDNLWTERKEKRRRGRPRKDSKSDSCDDILDRERPRKETQSDALEDLQESPVIHQSTENGTSKEQLEDNLWTERKEKRRRGRPRKDSKSDSCDDISDRERPRKETQSDALEDLQESPVTHQTTENGASKQQLDDNLWTERKEKRRRGRPRKDSKSDSCDNKSDGVILSQVINKESRTGTRSKRDKKEQIESPNKEFRPYQPNISSPRNRKSQKREALSTEISPNSSINMPEKRLSIDIANSRSEKITEPLGSPFKLDKTRTDALETDVGKAIHQLQTVMGTEKKKRGRPRKEWKPNANDILLDIPSEQKVQGNGTRWRPLEVLGLTSTSHETSANKPLQATGSRTDEAPSERQKQVSLDKFLRSKKPQAQRGIIPGILKKRKKRSPLKVNVGKQLANKKQRSLDSTRPSKSSHATGKSTLFKKPLTDVLHGSDLLGKPKKRVSFEDAINLMGNLSDDEGLGKDLFMKDIVSQTAMKEVMKIVKHAKLGSHSILDLQPESKTSVFFSIKKS